MTIIDITEVSSSMEIQELTNLLNIYVNNHYESQRIFIKAIGYNPSEPILFLIDDDDNCYVSTNKNKLRKLTKKEERDIGFNGYNREDE